MLGFELLNDMGLGSESWGSNRSAKRHMGPELNELIPKPIPLETLNPKP